VHLFNALRMMLRSQRIIRLTRAHMLRQALNALQYAADAPDGAAMAAEDAADVLFADATNPPGAERLKMLRTNPLADVMYQELTKRGKALLSHLLEDL